MSEHKLPSKYLGLDIEFVSRLPGDPPDGCFYVLGEPDWSRIVCTTATSTADVTMEQLQEMQRRLNALPKPGYDALVFLRPTWAAFRKKAADWFVEDGFSTDRLAGIPVYVYHSEAELADGSIVKVEGKP